MSDSSRAITVSCPAGRITGTAADGVAQFHSIDFCAIPEPFGPSARLEPSPEKSIDATVARPDDIALTITAPEDASFGSDCPVVVYIHGGRFETGTHEDPRAEGSANARAGIVQVQLGYRVGLEGFARFHKDEPHRYRGIDDCQHGLEWIQRNIEHFGGDPTNVTIVGQSAGATTALWLARKDHYRGAFRRIVAFSPCYPRQAFEQRKSSLRMILGAPVTRQSLTTIAATNPKKLRKAYSRFRTRYVTDMALGPAPLDCSELVELPIVMGSLREEFNSMPVARKADSSAAPKLVAKLLSTSMGIARGAFEGWYQAISKVDPKSPTGKLVSDSTIRRWVAQVGELAPGPTWMIECVRDGDPATNPALHCQELRYIFGVHSDDTRGPVAEKFNAWLHRFARTGEVSFEQYQPNHAVWEFNLDSGADRMVHGTLDYVAAAFPFTGGVNEPDQGSED